ncbi:ABC transporter substrate-binding protein [Pseudodesulfovibrio tunisiensis]|uniref:ABC transporter substrate-binding protein n=1 Tax=Pseudodesulfovibrio tunisiensis TaxID=463192 RepID=UPI001FB4ABE9|nr:ABC transporter substrate-binding protein [Pseudodesulfovibrio tunisiensis]
MHQTRLFVFLVLFLAAMLAEAVCAPSAHSASPKTVLVIHSYHPEYEWVREYSGPLYSELLKQAQVESFYLDSKRLSPKNQFKQIEAAWQTFRDISPSLVVLCDDNALKSLGNRIGEAGTPIVYLGINGNPRNYLNDIHYATGALERPLFKRSIIFLQEILGDRLKRLLILFDNSTTSWALVEEAFNDRTFMGLSPVAVDLRFIEEWHEWRRTVFEAKEDDYDAAIVALYHTIKDAAGNHVPEDMVLDWTGEHSPIPLFAYWDFAIGQDKTLGGLVQTGHIQGETAGDMARQILKGTPISSIPPRIPEQGRFVFSRSGLKKWEITLPESIAERATFVD